VTEPTLQRLDVNGLRMQVAIQGSGPLVLLCHGFPELWISWRSQLSALAAAGYRAVAPDMRGYGGTTAPEGPTAYTLLHLVGTPCRGCAALTSLKVPVTGFSVSAQRQSMTC
jgi:pimeloyl-ACP methyl ester carboxylesterase